jgi:hypothetical protein
LWNIERNRPRAVDGFWRSASALQGTLSANYAKNHGKSMFIVPEPAGEFTRYCSLPLLKCRFLLFDSSPASLPEIYLLNVKASLLCISGYLETERVAIQTLLIVRPARIFELPIKNLPI